MNRLNQNGVNEYVCKCIKCFECNCKCVELSITQAFSGFIVYPFQFYTNITNFTLLPPPPPLFARVAVRNLHTRDTNVIMDMNVMATLDFQ